MRIYTAILALFLLSSISLAKVDDSKLKIYTVADVLTHKEIKSCWVVMDKYIYDVTKFLEDHPGSFKILASCCGKDCTKGYNDKGIDEPHSKKSHKMREKMIIGILKEKM